MSVDTRLIGFAPIRLSSGPALSGNEIRILYYNPSTSCFLCVFFKTVNDNLFVFNML